MNHEPEPEATGDLWEVYGRPRPDPGARLRHFPVRRPYFTTGMGVVVTLLCGLGVWILVEVSTRDAWPVAVALALLPVAVVLVGRGLYVRLVPPDEGPSSYAVCEEGLVWEDAHSRLVVHWDEVLAVRHRPTAVEEWGTFTVTHSEYLELALEGSPEPLVVVGVPRQDRLTALVVQHTLGRIVDRLAEDFTRAGALRLGELSLTEEGVRGADGTLLAWSPDWRLSQRLRPAGAELRIRGREGGIRGQVPQLAVARALLTRLARRPTV
ncbi:hypothetical protein [Streptomyces sp. NPDC005438]|uniref:hypothetical protein n=1 Tax=Streptomyces sp. NPDC005438 TaxID=3156880 RepID=UPI0033B9DD4C